jgi:uncharacterized protein
MTIKKTAPGKGGPLKKPVGKKPAPAPRKRGGKKKAGKKTLSFQIKRAGIGMLILVALCLTGAMVADLMIRQPADPPSGTIRPPAAPGPREKPSPVHEGARDADPIKPQAGLMEKNGHPFVFEVFEGIPDPRKSLPPVRPLPGEDAPVRIALIIDDIGYDKQIAMALHALEPNISFSVLPWSPHGRSISRMLKEKGAEIMLHLPMEPMEYPRVDPGPGALLVGMSPDMLIAQLEKNLDEVPGASGVNNHMGSRLTTEASQMYQIFTILRKKDLFFIDSLTAPGSQCRAAARLLQVRFGERDVFLDNIQEKAYITGQFAQLKKLAMEQGIAVGIGHPYPATLETLKIELPKIRGKIKIIPASQVVAVPH